MKNRLCIISEFPPAIGGVAYQAELLGNLLEKDGQQVKRLATNPISWGVFGFAKNLLYLKTIVTFTLFIVGLLRSLPKVDILHIFATSYLNYFLFTYPATILGKICKE